MPKWRKILKSRKDENDFRRTCEMTKWQKERQRGKGEDSMKWWLLSSNSAKSEGSYEQFTWDKHRRRRHPTPQYRTKMVKPLTKTSLILLTAILNNVLVLLIYTKLVKSTRRFSFSMIFFHIYAVIQSCGNFFCL